MDLQNSGTDTLDYVHKMFRGRFWDFIMDHAHETEYPLKTCALGNGSND